MENKPKLRQFYLNLLATQTGKSHKEIKAIYERFVIDFPDGKAPKEEFQKLFPVYKNGFYYLVVNC